MSLHLKQHRTGCTAMMNYIFEFRFLVKYDYIVINIKYIYIYLYKYAVLYEKR